MLPVFPTFQVLAVGGVLAVAVGFAAGWQVNGWRLEARTAAAERQAADAYKAGIAAGHMIADAYIADAQKTRVVYRTIKEKAHALPTTCSVSSGYVRLWNDALTGKLSTSTSRTAETPPGTDLAPAATDREVMSNHIDNAELAGECRAQLNALIDWHGKVDRKD